MSLPRMRRSVLFLPASNPRAVEKAATLDADVVVLDLEDAVSLADKGIARAAARDAILSGGLREREVVVRINPLDTHQGVSDLEVVAPAGPDAILLPKVSNSEDISSLCAALDANHVRRGMAIWAMIETPMGVLNLKSIAELGVKRRLAALMLGANDLGKEMRLPAPTRRRIMESAMFELVLVARAFGLAAIDAVFNAHQDVEGFAHEARQARNFGFDGKSLIHPLQIEPCHCAFAPTEDEVMWARKIVTAFATPTMIEPGVITVDGQMVERLHLDEAQRILQLSDV